MQNVTIHFHNKPSQVIPVTNLQRTIDLMQNEIKKVDYGKAPKPPVTAVSESKPDMTWKKKKLLKYARSKNIEVQDNDTKSMILTAIENGGV